ncbi:MAG: peptide chain release factor 1 [Alphaproteobacteria bacterium]|nr:peptide chain release factor 1 [Alphaproteobacteria bacterium]
MSLDAKFDHLDARFGEIEREMAGERLGREAFARLAREYSDLKPVVEVIRALRAARSEEAGLEEILADGSSDAEMREIAEAERDAVAEKIAALGREVRVLLLPKDAADEANVILELRAGTGGEEACLFAGDLFRMYQRYAALHGWRVEILSASESDLGGFKELIANVSGAGVFRRLKYESGVHRVQRVPETEGGGRIHTSAATVAVLPEPEDVEIEINEADLRIDVYRSSGPGGQSVNTTDSAVRITHLPTGLVVTQQDEKSQHKNKAKALKVLRARLYDIERERADAERAAARKGQVGTGDRSERIRTYNFPQGRVTDHRINLTLYKLDLVLAGEALDELIEPLIAEDQASRLAALEGAPE